MSDTNKQMNEVYTEDNQLTKDNLQEITVEQVYLTIPADYVCVYHKLLTYMADFGKVIVDDCTASCKGRGKNILNCWNLFQSAIACHAIGRDEESDFFIEYIKGQLKLIYQGTGQDIELSTTPVAITPDGKLKAIIGCDDKVHFYVDPETGKLYQAYLDNQAAVEATGRVYDIQDDDLVTAKGKVNDSGE